MSNVILNGAFNGITWGPDGTFRCERTKGFDDLPRIESRDQPKAVRDGRFAGNDLLTELDVFVVLTVAGINTTDADFRASLDAVNAAFSRQTTPKALRFWNLSRYVWARPRERTWSDCDAKWAQHIATCTTRLVVVDPTVYLGAPPP